MLKNENPLQDHFGRQFRYLRLSITDACNFKCIYCLPNGYQAQPKKPPPLSLVEIENTVRAFVALGFWKFRITGGEPTLRRDLIQIFETLNKLPGVDSLALSTNGYRLKHLARPLKDAGVQALNISVDSLDPKNFEKITGQGNLDEILRGIELSLSLGFKSVKVNAVLLNGFNQNELDLFLDWIRNLPITVRFIELMQTGLSRSFFEKHHLSAGVIQLKLMQSGWKPRERKVADGPALEFDHPDYLGRIGLIAPYSKDFCSTCNRLRVSSQGGLRLCLFGEKDHPIRHLLQRTDQQNELVQEVQTLLNGKAISHFLNEGNYGNTQNFAAIGG